MPVFARIATADPVETTSITSTTADPSAAITDAILVDAGIVCTCDFSDDDVLVLGRNSISISSSSSSSISSSASEAFYALTNCPVHSSVSPVYSQLKLMQQQLTVATTALMKQRQKEEQEKQQKQFIEEEERQRVSLKVKRQRMMEQQERERRRDPFACVRMMPTGTFHLYAGSRFLGKQKSGTHSYEVMVDIKHVDLNDSRLCGYLHIKGLTEEYPELTTFFDAEIIGSQHLFLTKRWDVSESNDKEHWTRLDPTLLLPEQDSGSDPCTLEELKFDYRESDVVFMRWKEHFLVPDHHLEGITGASFAGFYYICYRKSTGQIDGYYYHQSSEPFQQLYLGHMEERTSFGTYEFR